MSLAQDLGLPLAQEVPDDLALEYHGALISACTLLVRGGVTVPYAQWITWAPGEREALAEAAERIHALRVTDAAAAQAGPGPMSAVRSRGDGGEMALRMRLESQCHEIKRLAGSNARA